MNSRSPILSVTCHIENRTKDGATNVSPWTARLQRFRCRTHLRLAQTRGQDAATPFCSTPALWAVMICTALLFLNTIHTGPSFVEAICLPQRRLLVYSYPSIHAANLQISTNFSRVGGRPIGCLARAPAKEPRPRANTLVVSTIKNAVP